MRVREVYFMDSFEKWTSKDDCFGKWNVVGNSTTTDLVARTENRSMLLPYNGTGVTRGIPRWDDSYHCVSCAIYLDPGAYLNPTQGLIEISSKEGSVLYGDIHAINARVGISDEWKVVTEVGSILGFFPYEQNTVRNDTSISIPKKTWFHLGLKVKFKMVLNLPDSIRVEIETITYVNEIAYSWTYEIGTGIPPNHLYPEWLIYPRSFKLGQGSGWGSFGGIVKPFEKIYYDDLYYSKHFLGDLEVGYLDPDGNLQVGWTPSLGQNWEAVKKSTQATEPKVSKSVGAASTPEVCTMEQPIEVEEVIAVQGVLLGKKDPGTTVVLGTLYGSVSGDNLAINKSPVIVTDTQDRIPGTEDYWTVEALEDLNFGGIDAH